MTDTHVFAVTVSWPAATTDKPHPDPAFSRNNTLSAAEHLDIDGSAPPAYGGEASGYNPEELLILSLSQCHMLTYLAIAARRNLGVQSYEDRATGTLGKGPTGRMQLIEVILHPRVTVAKGADLNQARDFHDRAHGNCFIANSVNFPVRHEPRTIEA